MNRYSRQEAIGGWDQSRLADACVVVAGSGAAALLTALAAVAMGFGSIELLKLRGRTRENGMFSRLVSGTGRAWVDFLRQVNPTIRIAEVSTGNASSLRRTFSRASCVALVGSTAIENRFHSLLERCPGVPIIRGWTGSSGMCWGPVTASAVEASDRGDGVSDLLLAGFVVEELRQTILPLPGDPDDLDLVKRSTLARAPFVRSPPPCGRLSMVGAGALGTWVSLGLGLANAAVELHIFDADHVEENNLNRQVLYFGAVGKPKSLTLARRIARLFPSVKASGYALFLEESTMNWLPPSGQLVACPDNYAVRDVLNDCAVAAGHSLVSGILHHLSTGRISMSGLSNRHQATRAPRSGWQQLHEARPIRSDQQRHSGRPHGLADCRTDERETTTWSLGIRRACIRIEVWGTLAAAGVRVPRAISWYRRLQMIVCRKRHTALRIE